MSGERVLVVDDEAPMRRTISRSLAAVGYECTSAADVEEARRLMTATEFDLVVCDLRMPGQSGLALVKEIEAGPEPTAVLMVTGVDDPEIAHRATLLGANGYLVKPFSVNELRINVDQALEEGRRRAASAEVEREQEKRIHEVREVMNDLEHLARSKDHQAADLLVPLSEAVGRRDLETGAHIRRIGESSAILAAARGMTSSEVESIRLAAPMHDVGKVAIPDSVLLKPGRLDPDERSLMERHAEIGHDILSGSDSPLLDLAAEIALNHHEKVDGSGYPRGIEGPEIPLSGRIVAIADVFDALTSDRPYRKAMPLAKALSIMGEGRGTHFDPDLFDLFIENLDEVIAMAERFRDSPEGNEPTAALDEPGTAGPPVPVRRIGPSLVSTPPAELSRMYVDALIAADGEAARQLAISFLRDGMTVESIYGDVITPAMNRVGQLWKSGSITMADENLATGLTDRVMASLRDAAGAPNPARRQRILLAMIEGQRHSLGLRMVADVLGLAGFQVLFLGEGLPKDALLDAVGAKRPDLVGLSFTIVSEPVPVDSVVSDLRDAFPGIPIVVGGQGVAAERELADSVTVVPGIRGIVPLVERLIAA